MLTATVLSDRVTLFEAGSNVALPASVQARSLYVPVTLLWGRHDPYFDLNEVMAYNRVLENVETHIFESAHFLLDTHGPECVALIRDFVQNAEASRAHRPRHHGAN